MPPASIGEDARETATDLGAYLRRSRPRTPGMAVRSLIVVAGVVAVLSVTGGLAR